MEIYIGLTRYICIHIYTHMYACMYLYMYLYTCGGRERGQLCQLSDELRVALTLFAQEVVLLLGVERPRVQPNLK